MQKILGNSIRKVFVTGGAGFIGSHVVDQLVDHGYQVCVYDNLSNGRREYISAHFEKPNFTFIEADLLDMERLQGEIKGYAAIPKVCTLRANSNSN